MNKFSHWRPLSVDAPHACMCTRMWRTSGRVHTTHAARWRCISWHGSSTAGFEAPGRTSSGRACVGTALRSVAEASWQTSQRWIRLRRASGHRLHGHCRRPLLSRPVPTLCRHCGRRWCHMPQRRHRLELCGYLLVAGPRRHRSRGSGSQCTALSPRYCSDWTQLWPLDLRCRPPDGEDC